MIRLMSSGRRGAAAARRVAGTRVQLRAASGSSDSKDALVLRESVRKLDYDHYLCGLLLPIETRPAFFAIRAMNAEVASIKDSVRSNHLTGKIRLQWWRERIYALYESPSSGDEASRETLLLRELARAVQQHGLTRRWFERLLDARDQDLDVEQPRSLAELESYADKTAASLLYLTLECLGVRDTAADRAAHHAGMAIGLATLLRGTPFHALRQQVYLPEELMHQHGVSLLEVLAAAENPEDGAKAAPVVFAVACRAMEHLREARTLAKDVPKQARPALLPLVSTSMFLDELEKVNFNAFDPRLQQRSMLDLHFQVLKHYFLRKY